MDNSVTKSEFETKIAIGIDEKNNILYKKLYKSNAPSQSAQRDRLERPSSQLHELGIDGPIQFDHMIAMENLQTDPTQG